MEKGGNRSLKEDKKPWPAVAFCTELLPFVWKPPFPRSGQLQSVVCPTDVTIASCWQSVVALDRSRKELSGFLVIKVFAFKLNWDFCFFKSY